MKTSMISKERHFDGLMEAHFSHHCLLFSDHSSMIPLQIIIVIAICFFRLWNENERNIKNYERRLKSFFGCHPLLFELRILFSLRAILELMDMNLGKILL